MTLQAHRFFHVLRSEGDGGGEGQAPAFTYSDEHKDYVTTKGWKGTDDVITSNKHLESLLGADKAGRAVIWPKDDQDKDGWKSIYSKLGVPEKPDDYGFAGDGEEGVFAKEFAAQALANNIPKGAAGAMLNWMREAAKKGADAEAAQALQKGQAEMQALETEWGTAATANKELARRFAAELGATPEQLNAMEQALGTAVFMKLFHAGGTKLGEQRSVQGDSKGGFGVTQAEARQQINQARADRLAGKLNETDFHALMSRLGPIAEPGTSAAA